jgi:hypothetical protein
MEEGPQTTPTQRDSGTCCNENDLQQYRKVGADAF